MFAFVCLFLYEYVLISTIVYFHVGLDPFEKQLVADKGNPSHEWRINK